MDNMENKTQRCIVNFAQGNWYPRGAQRLRDAKKFCEGIDILTLDNYDTIGSPTHAQDPYAFKVYAMEYAFNQGYTTVLYVDSSLHPVKDCRPVFDYIEENGHLMQKAGHMLSRWCNETAKNYYNFTPEEWSKFELYSAGFTGLDFLNERSQEFFLKWKQSQLDGMFKGDWKDHRHDMTNASAIAQRLGMNFEERTFMQYIGQGYAPANDFAYFHCHPC